jgi:hypothetical protein
MHEEQATGTKPRPSGLMSQNAPSPAEMIMRLRSLRPWALFGAVSALAVIAQIGPAPAKGCIKGAIVGGAAGHFAGHHGAVGAAAGCAIGHHEANKKSNAQTNGQSSK